MSINLLPWREHNQLKQKQKAVTRIIIYCLSLCVFCFMGKFILYVHTTYCARRIEMTEKQIQSIKLSDPLKKQDALLSKLIFFHHQQQSEIELNHVTEKSLFIIANTIPISVTLSQLSLSSNKITLTGIASQLGDIHQYINNLQQQMPHSMVSLTNTQTHDTNQSILQFVISINKNAGKHYDKNKTHSS